MYEVKIPILVSGICNNRKSKSICDRSRFSAMAELLSIEMKVTGQTASDVVAPTRFPILRETLQWDFHGSV